MRTSTRKPSASRTRLPVFCASVFLILLHVSSSKKSLVRRETEPLPEPSEVYATSVFGAGGAKRDASEKAAPLVVGEREGGSRQGLIVTMCGVERQAAPLTKMHAKAQ